MCRLMFCKLILKKGQDIKCKIPPPYVEWLKFTVSMMGTLPIDKFARLNPYKNNCTNSLELIFNLEIRNMKLAYIAHYK